MFNIIKSWKLGAYSLIEEVGCKSLTVKTAVRWTKSQNATGKLGRCESRMKLSQKTYRFYDINNIVKIIICEKLDSN